MSVFVLLYEQSGPVRCLLSCAAAFQCVPVPAAAVADSLLAAFANSRSSSAICVSIRTFVLVKQVNSVPRCNVGHISPRISVHSIALSRTCASFCVRICTFVLVDTSKALAKHALVQITHIAYPFYC